MAHKPLNKAVSGSRSSWLQQKLALVAYPGTAKFTADMATVVTLTAVSVPLSLASGWVGGGEITVQSTAVPLIVAASSVASITTVPAVACNDVAIDTVSFRWEGAHEIDNPRLVVVAVETTNSIAWAGPVAVVTATLPVYWNPVTPIAEAVSENGIEATPPGMA